MKVKDLIQMLTIDFSPDEELMVMWWDSAYSERLAGTWDKAVKVFDDGGVSTFTMDEQISELLSECEAEVRAELAIDSYLEQEDEKELANG
jgi:tRNA U54 and U55 pseudouridine synthase Pus10